jgi:predicted kinase
MNKTSPEAARILEQIDISDKPIALMGIGIPASGKSTLLEEIAWQSGPRIQTINIDAIRNRFLRLRAGKRLAEFIDQEFYKQIEDDIDNYGLAIIDGTNVDGERRVLDIGRYKDLGAVCVGGVFMDTEISIAAERNAGRAIPVTSLCLNQMSAALIEQRPSIEEGFDWLVTVKPDDITVTARV